MTAPVWQTGATLAPGFGTSAAIPVPAGVAVDDIIVVCLYIESTATVTAPGGFTQKDLCDQTDASEAHRQYVYWKRATGADSGTYTFSWTGSVGRCGHSNRISGCIGSGDPFDATFPTVSSGHVTTPPGVSLTTSVTDTLLIWAVTNGNGTGTWTAPTSFTKHNDIGNMADGDLAQAAAGSTGTLTGSWSGGATAMTAWLGALKPPSSGPVDDAPPWQFSVIAPGWTAPGGDFQAAALGAFDLAANLTVDDPAAAADALNVTATTPLAETAATSDSLTVSATVALTETAAGSDAIAAGQPVPVSDTGSAADALSVTAVAALADTASAADALTAASAAALTDTATGVDALSIMAAVPLTQTASGADALAETVTVPLSDTASAADVLSVGGSATPSLPDTATAVDALAAAVAVPLTDSAAAADLARPAVALALAESALAVDLLAVAVGLALADVATATDAAVGVLVPDVTRGSMTGGVGTTAAAAGTTGTTTTATGGARLGASMGGE